ncbi:hypothetical protein VKT23_020557 [Stygiomarasmius scandens]|uniref:Uncharacterized protein n=1 Tax=Marasmiellus scandens TaxID=2682957 RepID=A0ABR1IKJ9_9AGAR
MPSGKTDRKKTGRCGWYTAEVEEWLLGFLDECKKLSKSKKIDNFYTVRARELWLKFPQAAALCAGLTADNSNSLSDAPPQEGESNSQQSTTYSKDENDFNRKMGWDKLPQAEYEKKKEGFEKCRYKISEYYRHRMHGSANDTDKVLGMMMDAATPNRPQKLTMVQMFGKLYRESLILPVMEKEWKKCCDEYKHLTGATVEAMGDGENEAGDMGNDNDKSGPGNNPNPSTASKVKKPTWIAVYNLKQLFEQQSEETKRHVAAEVKRVHKEALLKKEAMLDEEKMPEELEMAMNKLGVVACRFANATANQSKHLVSMVIIGPNSRDGGNIELKWVHVGNTPGGLIWPEYDPRAFKEAEKALIRFGEQCFNAEARAARAIPNSIPLPLQPDEDSWTVPQHPTEIAASIVRKNADRQRLGPGRNSANIVSSLTEGSTSGSRRSQVTSGIQQDPIPPPSGPRLRPSFSPPTPAPEKLLETQFQRAVSMDPDVDITINFLGATKAYLPLPQTPSPFRSVVTCPRSNSDTATAQPDPALFPHFQSSSLQSGTEMLNGPNNDDAIAQDENPIWNHPRASEFWPALKEVMSSFKKGAKWTGWPELVTAYIALEEHFGFVEDNGKFRTRKETSAIKYFQTGNGDPSDQEVQKARAKFPKAWSAWWDDIMPNEDANEFYLLDSTSGKGGLYKLVLGLFWWGKWVHEEVENCISEEDTNQARERAAEWVQNCLGMHEILEAVLEHVQGAKGRKRKATVQDSWKKSDAKKRKTSPNRGST